MGRFGGDRLLLVLTLVYSSLFTSLTSTETLNLPEGASCGIDKICMRRSQCSSIPKHSWLTQKEKICGYNKRHLAIVCCPMVTDRKPQMPAVNKTISERKCEQYAEYVYAPPQYAPWSMHGAKPKRGPDMCGLIAVPLIAGGETAAVREFPHMVQIGYGSPHKKPNHPDAWLCGGSLISERFVLSAAHCTYLEVNRKALRPGTKVQFGGLARWARMGAVNTQDPDTSAVQTLKIVDWINRTDYNGTGFNDIVLFKLEADVMMNPRVHPICLQVNEYIEETSAIAIGFGKLRHGSRKLNTNLLQKVRLNLLENKDCKEFGLTLFAGGIQDTQLCAGDSVGHDACPGDSGGPLQVPLRPPHPYCMYSLIGITSGGSDKCGSGTPSIFTRVSKYISWIEENVWPDEK